MKPGLFQISIPMKKNKLIISAVSLLAAVVSLQVCDAKQTGGGPCNKNIGIHTGLVILTDTIPVEVVDIVTAAVYSINTFNIEKVADLYTPNAVIADDEPPYSWNGPTAGVQWVNAVEQACKDNRLTKLKGTIEEINVFHQTAENVYVVVPVTYTGNLPGKQVFKVEGAFTFVLRMIDGKWMIKSQVWMPKKAM
jgi:ketosteroid isomerase-like protein